MKTFIIDWGDNANGSRFALIQATNITRAFWDADCIGSPFKIAELRIPLDDELIRYTEISPSATPYAGVALGKCGSFKESANIYKEVLES